jgi:hypothetical protein
MRLIRSKVMVLVLAGIISLLIGIGLKSCSGGDCKLSGGLRTADCPGFWDFDVCLDLGGCWDYTDKVCRKDEPDAQSLCSRDAACVAEGGCWDYLDKVCRKVELNSKQLCDRSDIP